MEQIHIETRDHFLSPAEGEDTLYGVTRAFARCTLFSPSVKSLYLVLLANIGQCVEWGELRRQAQVPPRGLKECIDALREARLLTTHKISGRVVYRVCRFVPGVTVPPDTDGEDLVLARPEPKVYPQNRETAAELATMPLCDPEEKPLRYFKQVYAKAFLALPEWGKGGAAMAGGQLKQLVEKHGGEVFAETLRNFVSDDKTKQYGYTWWRFMNQFERYRPVKRSPLNHRGETLAKDRVFGDEDYGY